jgi:hypothetical protein
MCGFLLLCGMCFIIRKYVRLFVFVLFICSLCVLRLYMRKRSNMFSKGPFFFSMWSMCAVQIWSSVCWPLLPGCVL